MKRFTVPCNFGDKKSPFNFYVGDPSDGFAPLHFQRMWLRQERGGEVPEEVVDSFNKLLNIARENDVSFEELCVYALGSAQKKS
jgi:hypothetical protein